MGRSWHELRVREQVSPNRWEKKSKFYFVPTPGDAVALYQKRNRVPHTIMWCEKDRRHRPDRLVAQTAKLERELRLERREASTTTGAFRGFLGLGDELLGELRGSGKKNRRRNNGYSRKEAPDQLGSD